MMICCIYSGSIFALKCGRSLVELGDYREDVYDKCGEPDTIQSHYERRSSLNHAEVNPLSRQLRNNALSYGQAHYREVEILVEEWRYDFGRQRLRKLLRFENGKLIEIVNLGRRR